MKKLDKLIVHEDFNKLTLDNDIALLLLDSPIRLNEHKVPVCLPLIHDLRTWKNCWVAGWGTTVAGTMPWGEGHLTDVFISIQWRCFSPSDAQAENQQKPTPASSSMQWAG